MSNSIIRRGGFRHSTPHFRHALIRTLCGSAFDPVHSSIRHGALLSTGRALDEPKHSALAQDCNRSHPDGTLNGWLVSKILPWSPLNYLCFVNGSMNETMRLGPTPCEFAGGRDHRPLRLPTIGVRAQPVCGPRQPRRGVWRFSRRGQLT